MTDLHQDDEYDRRFAGVAKIYGGEAFNHYEKSHVMVIGIGGVGSWAVEAVVRTGAGEVTLVDMDSIAASNINRQLPAMTSTFGHEKIEVMAERCRQINPRIKINLIEDYLSAENIKEILAETPDLILDCIDDVKAKLALMLHCRFNKIPLIVSGGAGGKLDPLKCWQNYGRNFVAWVFVKSQKKSLVLLVSIQLIIHSQAQMSVLVQDYVVVVMVRQWWSLLVLPWWLWLKF